MAFPVIHAANTLLQKDFKNGRASITHLKMQKLMYYLHGWHLAITGEPAIDKPFRAWPYGPVEENLYHALKHYGRSPITAYIPSEAGENLVVSPDARRFHEILDMVWENYSRFSGPQLSTMTHQAGSPWDQTYNSGSQPIIEDSLIKAYFKGRLNV